MTLELDPMLYPTPTQILCFTYVTLCSILNFWPKVAVYLHMIEGALNVASVIYLPDKYWVIGEVISVAGCNYRKYIIWNSRSNHMYLYHINYPCVCTVVQ